MCSECYRLGRTCPTCQANIERMSMRRMDVAPDGADLVRRASEAYREGGVTLLQIRLEEAGLSPESIAMITHLIRGREAE